MRSHGQRGSANQGPIAPAKASGKPRSLDAAARSAVVEIAFYSARTKSRELLGAILQAHKMAMAFNLKMAFPGIQGQKCRFFAVLCDFTPLMEQL